jgi:thiamine-phosphate pyrophosphorylase
MSAPCLLYYITDRTTFPGDENSRHRHLLAKISEATRANVDYIQLREKDLPSRDLESLAKEAVSLIARLRAENRNLRTALLINSRTDVALAVQADGVHLRADDISPQEVRKVWKCASVQCGAGALARVTSPDDPLIGVSCHSSKDLAQAAANQASFAVFAPVFEKKDASPAGVDLLREVCQAKIPVLALGGITLSNAHSCLEAGAAGIAAIRLFQENNIFEIARGLRQKY